MARSRNRLLARIATFAMLAMCQALTPIFSQQNLNANQPAALADRLSQKYSTPVLVDPAIVMTGKPEFAKEAASVEAALDDLAGRLPHTAWRRVYLTEEAGQDRAAKLAAAARMLDRIGLARLVVENTTAHSATTLMKDRVDTPTFRETLRKSHFRAAPLYLIYSTTAAEDGRTPQERFLELQRDLLTQLETYPEQGNAAMDQSMQWWMHLDPSVMRPLAERMAEAGGQIWQEVEPEQRQAMMEQFVQTAQQAARETGNTGVPGPETRGASGYPNYRSELERLAARLAHRYQTQCAVDPAIFLTVPPKAPDETPDVLAAMTQLMQPLKGTAWRRVSLKRLPDTSAPRPEKLAEIARALEHLEIGSLALENPRTGLTALLRNHTPIAEIEKIADAVPSYLMYAASPSEAGKPLSPEERIGSLLRRQQEMMLTMDRNQLAQAMGQGVQSWQNQDGAGQARLLRTPMIAGVMAAWLPLRAKEAKGP